MVNDLRLRDEQALARIAEEQWPGWAEALESVPVRFRWLKLDEEDALEVVVRACVLSQQELDGVQAWPRCLLNAAKRVSRNKRRKYAREQEHMERLAECARKGGRPKVAGLGEEAEKRERRRLVRAQQFILRNHRREEPKPDQQLEWKECEGWLGGVFESLPGDLRRIGGWLWERCRRDEGFVLADAATEFGVSVRTVKRRLRKIRKYVSGQLAAQVA
jgi:AraC-like DNA-binding protein